MGKIKERGLDMAVKIMLNNFPPEAIDYIYDVIDKCSDKITDDEIVEFVSGFSNGYIYCLKERVKELEKKMGIKNG